jgi:thiol:disulfide interchange protein DsbD
MLQKKRSLLKSLPMKKILPLFVVLLSLGTAAFSQMGSAKQVNWSFTSKKIGDKKYEVRITAIINGNYHMYAINAGVDLPAPTKISFAQNPLLNIQGKTIEQGKKITKFESIWDGKVNYFEKTVTFIQLVNTKTAAKTNLNGKVEFMVCNDEACLPPSEVPFKIAIGG